MNMVRVLSVLVLMLVFISAPQIGLFAELQPVVASTTAEQLFDMMEKRTEKINSIRVNVRLQNNIHTKKCCLTILNPDKFLIEFDDASIQAVFNGQKLWLKIDELKEVFYHFANESLVFSYVPLLNPARVFSNLTRKGLFALFKVSMVGQEKENTTGRTFYTLKFVPKMRTVFKEVFSIGHYIMVFSDENYLPVKVFEYDPDGNERGRLIVDQYFVNEQIPAERFDFIPPPDFVLVPFSVVFAQKLEECSQYLVNKIGEAAENMKKSILDWGW